MRLIIRLYLYTTMLLMFSLMMFPLTGCSETKPEVTKAIFVLPIARSAPNLKISQGWIYSQDEFVIHPDIPVHFAVDFPEPWGTPVYAPADGWALSSYQTYEIKDANGRTIGYGLGHFVQMYHWAGLYSSYAHLSGINPKIPFFSPTLKDGNWQPTVIYTTIAEFKKKAQPVKQGDLIGYVGYSGLLLRPETASCPPQINPETDPTWDPAGAHLHWEIFTRTPDGATKDKRFDPFGIYGEQGKYDNVFKKAMGLILPSPDGSPEFAHP